MTYENPNYTQTPNLFIDTHMRSLSGAQVQLMLVILRFTTGYHRREAPIALSTFKRLTGLSKQGVVNAVYELEELGFISVIRNECFKKNIYELCLRPPPKPEIEEGVVNSVDMSSQEVVNSVDQGVVNSVDHRKKTLLERKPLEEDAREDLPKTKTPEPPPKPLEPSALPAFALLVGVVGRQHAEILWMQAQRIDYDLEPVIKHCLRNEETVNDPIRIIGAAIRDKAVYENKPRKTVKKQKTYEEQTKPREDISLPFKMLDCCAACDWKEAQTGVKIVNPTNEELTKIMEEWRGKDIK